MEIGKYEANYYSNLQIFVTFVFLILSFLIILSIFIFPFDKTQQIGVLNFENTTK